MRKIEKPWGYEEIWAETDKYVGKILTILPNHRLSLQYHEKKEETIYVLEGKLIVWVSDDETGKFIFNSLNFENVVLTTKKIIITSNTSISGIKFNSGRSG